MADARCVGLRQPRFTHELIVLAKDSAIWPRMELCGDHRRPVLLMRGIAEVSIVKRDGLWMLGKKWQK
jgi:hypothetical protein